MSLISRSPVVAANAVQSPVVDPNSGYLTRVWLFFFTALAKAVNAGLGADGTALKLGYPTTTLLGGVQASVAVSGRFVTNIDVYGVPLTAQPSVADIQGLGTGATTASSATAGGASALPATPEGYLIITINQTAYKVPFYAL